MRRVLLQMVRSGAIVRLASSRGSSPVATQPVATWGKWSPAATFFHFATKNVAWASGQALQELEDTLRARAAIEPPPPAMKRMDARATVALPRAVVEGEFRCVLLERRTWRGFAAAPVPLAAQDQLSGGSVWI